MHLSLLYIALFNHLNILDDINSDDAECMKCSREFDMNAGIQRPTEDTFNKYLSFFLNDLPYYECVKAGHAAYSTVKNFLKLQL